MAVESKSIPIRPQLGSSWRRSSSYLDDHQQYRSPAARPQAADLHGIDTVIENPKFASPPKTYRPYQGVPSKDEQPRIVEGVSHDFTHPNCAPARGTKSSRLVATLMYKPKPRASGHGASSVPSLRPQQSDSSIPTNLAPTTNIEAFPLEPPSAAEPEPLDHLYGSFISPLCITSFLHLMSGFPMAPGVVEPVSSHRCLDDAEHPLVVEVTLSPAPSPEYFSLADLQKHELVYRFEREWNVDVVIQHDRLWRRHPRLVVFDMDSTLITQEVIDLMAATMTEPADLGQKVSDITERAMNGELEFDEAFRQRVQLLKGLPASVFNELGHQLDITAGVRQLIKALKRLGVRTAVLSGGFLPLTSWLATELGIDHAHANEVVIDETTKRLTGDVQGIIVGRERKLELMLEIAAKYDIPVEQIVAVGDGANDLSMLAVAGLGVAWNAKPRVQMEARARLNSDSLLDLLYLFGFTSEDIDMLTE